MYTPFMQIEPTTRCNYTCGFCAGRSLPQVDMSLETFQTIIDNVDHLEHVELQGEGEPLMNPHFFDMVTLLRKKFPDVLISMITNGSLFTDEHIEQLLSHGINKVMVSMESADPVMFRMIRGGKLSRVERGLAALVKTRDASRKQLPEIGLSITVLKKTVDQLDAISGFYRRLGLDGGVTLQLLNGMNCYTQYYDDEMLAQIPNKSDVARFNQLANTPAMQSNLSKAGSVPGFYQHLYAQPSAKPTCPWLENGLYVAANGTACSCCMIKDSNDGFEIFNKENVSEISRQRSAVLATLYSGNIPKACSECGTANKVVSYARNVG
ncbi:hypothetical protein A9Q99_25845 [Gammaproteobacteria bacterium 45_16_T64]|nr:hypothetical protein A9Q99_25845 [Gammaproteobacteria bacterium 45_16_T64]